MNIELKVPHAGESITEVEIGEWRKAQGDLVERDESVVELQTDKASMELPAPVSGRIAQILKKKGEIVHVGDVIGLIEESNGKEGVKAQAQPKSKSDAQKLPVEKPTAKVQAKFAKEPRVSPAAREMLRDLQVDAARIPGSGPSGQILKKDVDDYVGQQKTPVSAKEVQALEERVPMTPIRRRIAENLVAAQQTAALLTTFNEIDMSSVSALRKKYQEAFQKKYKIKLGFMSFFVKAVIEALKTIPELNAEIRGTDIIYKNYYDIGIAIGGGRGLVVPILRRAERLSFAEIEMAIQDFAQRAQKNTLKVEELQGGTFTITNGGVYGSMLSTPIVNPPQSGILGMHAIKDRPVALKGEVVIRPIMFVALTYDHRLVDGREAVTFLRLVKEKIETPTRILLEI